MQWAPRSAPASDREAIAQAMPGRLLGLIFGISGRHQIGLALLSLAVFLMSAVPLELQRRITNAMASDEALRSIVWLALWYLGVTTLEGTLKLGLNIYRGWVNESAVRWLRHRILAQANTPSPVSADLRGVDISLILAESDPVGSFVGVSISEPLLQGGILVSIFTYLAVLNPLMALVAIILFVPQIIFVPLMQRWINTRVRDRITTLREVGIGMVPVGELASTDGAQSWRIERIFTLNMSVYRLKFIMNFMMNYMYHLCIASVLAIGGYYVIHGQTEIGTIIAFISGLNRINDPWGDLVNWYRDLKVTETKYHLISRAVNRRGGPLPASP